MRRSLGLLLAGLVQTHSALAADVVLVRPPTPDPFIGEVFERVRGELEQHAFKVVEEKAEAEVSSLRAPTALFGRTHADACVSIGWRGETSVVYIWLAAAPGSGAAPALFETVALDRAPEVPTLLSTRTADLVRSGLHARDRGEAASLPQPQTPPDRVAPPDVEPPQASPWSLELSAAVFGQPSTFGPSLGPELALGRFLSRRVRVATRLSAPSWGAGHETRSASARLVQGAGLAELQSALVDGARVSAGVSTGAGAYFVSVRGQVADGVTSLRAVTDQQFTFAVSARVFAAVALSDRVSLALAGGPLLLLPRPRVAFGRESVAFKEPLLTFSAGLRWAL